jgi:hypothetical protein
MGEWMYGSTVSRPRQQLEVSSQLHAPAGLPPGAHWIGDWVDPIAGMEDVKRKLLTLQGLELRPLDRLASSQFAIPTTLSRLADG